MVVISKGYYRALELDSLWRCGPTSHEKQKKQAEPRAALPLLGVQAVYILCSEDSVLLLVGMLGGSWLWKCLDNLTKFNPNHEPEK